MTAALLAILRAYFSVCLFRQGPQELPAAGSFLALSATLYGLASTALVWPYEPWPAALLTGLVDTGLLLLLTWGLLLAHGLRSRFLQTGSALAGTGFLFSLFALPLFLLRLVSGNNTPLLLLVSLLLLLLVIWNIAVMAHILRHAVSGPFAIGVLLAIGYVWLITAALALIVPEGAGA